MIQEIKLEGYFYPMRVSMIAGRKDLQEDVLKKWDRFDMLSQEEKDVLISSDVAVLLKKISVNFRLTREDSEELSRIIRDVYFKIIAKSNLSHELANKIHNLDELNAQKISLALDQIFNLADKFKQNKLQTEEKMYDKLSVAQAIQKYLTISEQLVTAGEIVSQNFSMPVRPSVKNWIADYREKLGGGGKHSPVERGRYLFQSENAKKLSTSDRQKLGMLLKSLDEDTPLKVDIQNEAIVFENEKTSAISSLPRPQLVETDPRFSINNEQHLSSSGLQQNIRTQQTSIEVEDIFEKIKHYEAPSQNKADANSKDLGWLKDLQRRNTEGSEFSQTKPVNIGASTERSDLPKEEIFSLPNSKPQIGSEEYNVGKVNTDMVEKTEGYATADRTDRTNSSDGAIIPAPETKATFSFKQNFAMPKLKSLENLPVAKAPSFKEQISVEPTAPNKLAPAFPVAATQILQQPKQSPSQSIQAAEPSKSVSQISSAPPIEPQAAESIKPLQTIQAVEPAITNPEEMNDEMLWEMLRKKNLAKKATNLNSKTKHDSKPFYITGAHQNDAQPSPKNLVNLRDQQK